MKLFQQMLVAPAALGLLASGANAAELNINGVSDYAASADQVTSVTQFSDVYPTDWAYQALSNLVEQYGCVAGYPNGTFRGNRAMTRYEAAALLNACLDRITEVTDELRRLLEEFETELAILRGRVDGLEARVGELEATQFSTTTKLKGVTNWVLGAAKYHGQGSKNAAKNNGGTSFSYNLALNLETSFTGKDLLYTRLRSGNMNNIYGGNGVGLFAQEYGFDSGNTVKVNRLYYSFPVGDEFTIVGGPVVRMDDMLPVWPSAYPSDMTMDFFTYAGAPGAYNLTLGGGAGVYWQTEGGFSISTSYISTDGNLSDPNVGGVATDAAGTSATTQIAYAPEGWGLAAAYTYASGAEGGGALYGGNGTPGAVAISQSGNTNSVGLSAWWTPEDSGWIPSISTGWGLTDVSNSNLSGVRSATSQSWYVGLEWSDVFIEGNSFGMAVGQPTFITDIDVKGRKNESDYIAGSGYAWEFFYKFQVTDNITVTPAVHYLSKPYAGQDSDGLNAMSGLIKTTFKF
ncbi:possible porin [Synechococcus sp. BL107]|uniref:iron uptake porin n=1 Tax=Synechococcus sp. BL107 TaxID=313625 RepID=UPI0000E53BBD|nr:iron uptake porin [Synechococcus sp. BL107]EAU70861.1 possible porin [Synechococcus sp. BL107]